MAHLTRPWYTRANIPFPDVSTAALSEKSLLWLAKACLAQEVVTGALGAGGAPPLSSKLACSGSSDGSTAGMDGTDRWGSSFDGSKIIRASPGVAHSWIVMRHATLGVSLCWDYGSSSDVNCTFVGTYTEFTGGSTTARPTSTDEFAVLNQQVFHNGAGGVNHRFQFVTDAFGDFFMHVGQLGTGIANLAWWGCELAEGDDTDARKFFLLHHFLNTGRGAPGVALATVAGRTVGNTAAITGGLGRLTFGGQTFHGSMEANAANGKFDVLPALVGNINAGQAGVRGRFPDVVCGGALDVGGSDPEEGQQERACFGDLVSPHSVVPDL